MSSQYQRWGLKCIETGYISATSIDTDYDLVESLLFAKSMKDQKRFKVVEVEIREVKKRKAKVKK